MEKRIKERFTDPILWEAMHRYAIQLDNIRLLDGFESFIYEFHSGGGEFILRIGHSFRRSLELINGEVDWINYLDQGGAGVARAVLSENGRLVELIPDGQGEQFLATAFAKARGHEVHREDRGAAFYETYGRLLGRIHALSRSYRPSSPDCIRLRWDDPINIHVEKFLPHSERTALAHYEQLMAYLQSLSTDPEGFGMIHQDAHAGNFFIDDQGKITLFDFDDCCYGHFIYDIAMVLFYASIWEPDPAAFTCDFMRHFLTGYRHENRLDPKWLLELPHFMKLREIDLYSTIYRSFNIEHITDPWAEKYMRGRKERIDSHRPVIDFDFESLEEYC